MQASYCLISILASEPCVRLSYPAHHPWISRITVILAPVRPCQRLNDSIDRHYPIALVPHKPCNRVDLDAAIRVRVGSLLFPSGVSTVDLAAAKT